MSSPINSFNSIEVKELLSKFYEANFVKAGVSPGVGELIVEKAWHVSNSSDTSEESLKIEINNLFRLASKQAKSGIDEIDLLTLFDFSDTKTFLDFGANKLRVVNEICYKYPEINEVIGIDVVPMSHKLNYPERSKYFQIDPNNKSIPLKSNSVDFINIEFVFHHISDDKFIENALKEFKRILSPNGQVVLWEESFYENINVQDVVKSNVQKGIKTDLNLLSEFYKLSESEKWEFILINDWIINVNNKHMQWDVNYKKAEEWERLFIKNGFKLVRKYNLGLRLNALIKHGVHVIQVFELNS